MRVGVVATSYPRHGGDAAGGFVAAHAAYLRDTGAEVDVVAAGRGLPAPTGLFFDGGAPDALEAALTAPTPASLAVLWRALGFSARMVATVASRARRWDAIAAHWLAPSALAAALAPTRAPLLAIAHGGDVHLLARARLLAPVLAVLAARDARVVFVSDELRRRALDAVPAALARRVAARATVQPMGVDEPRLAAVARLRAARPPRPPGAPATIVVLARLVPVKAVDVAIDAMAHVAAPVELWIAGDGPQRRALERRAAAVAPRVRFTGWLDTDRRDALYARADLVVVPSAPTVHDRSEGTPMVALEALAAGIPLVASATGGLAALAAAGAVLVPPRDPRALAAAIERTLAAADPGARDLELGWRCVGKSLDRHWCREPGYAPAAVRAQGTPTHWSGHRAATARDLNHSDILDVSPTWYEPDT
jgi:glycosyltransferase involved in cell wall biosynthesis